MRLTTLLLATLLAGMSLSACTDEEPPPAAVEAAQLPDDLCAVVPDNIASRWSLEPASHETENTEDLSTATCTMAGDVDGDAVRVELQVTTFGGPDEEAATRLAHEALDDACADLDEDVDPDADPEGDKGPGRFVERDGGCTWTASSDATAQHGDAREAALLTTSAGVAHVVMSHTGVQWQLVPAEVVVLGAELTQTDLSAL